MLRAHAAPVPYYPPAGVNLQPILPQGYVWQNVQDNPDIPTFAFRQPSSELEIWLSEKILADHFCDLPKIFIF